MPDIDAILVAVADPQERSQPAVARAAQLATASGARLILFHAAFESYLSGRPFFDSKRLARSRGEVLARRTDELERLARPLRRHDLSVDVAAVWEEPVYEAIIRAAIRENATLVVAGPHGASGKSSGFSLRHTDWQLVRFCPKPLLLVHARPAARAGGVLAALDPTHANDKPAELDRRLLEWGTVMADALDCTLSVVHSIPRAAYPMSGDTALARRSLRARARRKLQGEIKRAAVAVARVHVVDGLAESAIPACADQHRARLLVMGALSRRGLRRFAIGNTAERIIQSVSCDLLVIKPAALRLELGRARTQSVILPRVSKSAG